MIITILHALANAGILSGAGVFYLILFSNIGRGHKAVEKFPAVGHWLVKVGLAATTAGAFLNIITLAPSEPIEVVMDLGIAALFLWAAVYHARKFGVLK